MTAAAENDPWEAIAPAQWKMSASGGGAPFLTSSFFADVLRLPQRGDVRLSSYPAGRVEIFRDGMWGTVCGHYYWNNNYGAATFCKQLGFRNII